MTVGMSRKSLEIQTLENRWFNCLVGAFLQVVLFFRLDKRVVRSGPASHDSGGIRPDSGSRSLWGKRRPPGAHRLGAGQRPRRRDGGVGRIPLSRLLKDCPRMDNACDTHLTPVMCVQSRSVRLVGIDILESKGAAWHTALRFFLIGLLGHIPAIFRPYSGHIRYNGRNEYGGVSYETATA